MNFVKVQKIEQNNDFLINLDNVDTIEFCRYSGFAYITFSNGNSFHVDKESANKLKRLVGIEQIL